jgi:tetratricopeptide (TPR) repeat protein
LAGGSSIPRSRCEDFSDSIDPKAIPKSNEEIRQLLNCLAKDTSLYVNSTKRSDDFVSHFQKAILPRLERRKRSEKLASAIDIYAQRELVRTTFVLSSFSRLFDKTLEDIQWWLEIEKYSKKFRRGEQTRITRLGDLTDVMKIAYEDFAHLSVLLSQMFFALEFSCKMLCSIGCYKFACRVSNSEVIYHKELMEQLKKLGKKQKDCNGCPVKESCNFQIDFLALARVYAYATQIRNLVDYTTRLASLNIFKSGLFEPPFPYFSHLKNVVENNFILAKKSLPKEFLAMTHSLSFRDMGERKKLYAPFSWDEKELIRLADKQPKDALSWFLLGKLYFKRHDTLQAIKCLEKAKKNNLKNSEAWRLLGILYDEKGTTLRDKQKALKHLEKARELDPENVEILFEVSIINLILGNALKTIEYMERAKKIPATNVGALCNPCVLNHVLYKAYSYVGDLAKANECLEKAKTIDAIFQKSFESAFESYMDWTQKFRKRSTPTGIKLSLSKLAVTR